MMLICEKQARVSLSLDLHSAIDLIVNFWSLAEALTPLAANLGCKGTPAWKALDETNGDFFWVHKTCHHCRIDGEFLLS